MNTSRLSLSCAGLVVWWKLETINFNPNVDKYNIKCVGWNYLSITKVNGATMDVCEYEYLSMLGLYKIHVSKINCLVAIDGEGCWLDGLQGI